MPYLWEWRPDPAIILYSIFKTAPAAVGSDIPAVKEAIPARKSSRNLPKPTRQARIDSPQTVFASRRTAPDDWYLTTAELPITYRPVMPHVLKRRSGQRNRRGRRYLAPCQIHLPFESPYTQ